MKIGGIQKLTLIDYPGKVSATIFTFGCNFRCKFCHNSDLVEPNLFFHEIKIDEILKFLEKRKKVLDGVVITGGEPTIHTDLPNFIKKIKDMGYCVKLDTNGSNPKMLADLIEKKLVDYIAMDIKAPMGLYNEIARIDVDQQAIRQSVGILLEEKIDYEFRTTAYPKLNSEEFVMIGSWIDGAKRFWIQQFRNTSTLDKTFQSLKPHSETKLEEIAEIMKKYVKEVGIRGLN